MSNEKVTWPVTGSILALLALAGLWIVWTDDPAELGRGVLLMFLAPLLLALALAFVFVPNPPSTRPGHAQIEWADVSPTWRRVAYAALAAGVLHTVLFLAVR